MVRSLPLPLPLSLLLLSLASLFVPAPLRAGPLDDPDHPLRPLPLRPRRQSARQRLGRSRLAASPDPFRAWAVCSRP